jgi:hypothetical protein
MSQEHASIRRSEEKEEIKAQKWIQYSSIFSMSSSEAKDAVPAATAASPPYSALVADAAAATSPKMAAPEDIAASMPPPVSARAAAARAYALASTTAATKKQKYTYGSRGTTIKASAVKTPAAAASTMTAAAQNIAASMPPPVSAAAAAARAYALAPTTPKTTTKKRKYNKKSAPRITTLIPQEVLRNNPSLFASQQHQPRKRGRPKGSKDTMPRKKPARASSEKPASVDTIPPAKPSITVPELSTQEKATLEAAQRRRQRHAGVVHKQQQKLQQAEADLAKAQQKLEAARKAAEKATQAAHDVALKDADDFLLEPNVWNFMYKRLLRFKEKHNGIVNIKRAMTQDDYDWGDNNVDHAEVRKLDKWQQDQRKAKRVGSLLQYQQILLDRLDFNWTPFQGPGPEKWFSHYEKLKKYKEEKGTCKVPYNYHDIKLVQWTKGQITQYRNGQEGKKPSLTQERIKLLEDIGFDWGVPRVITPWETRYQELLLFRSEFGHVNVPWCWKRNKALASWVNRQRNLYRDLNNGKRSTITAEQIEKLKSVGFQWSTKGTGRYKNDADATSLPKQEQQQEQEQQQQDYACQVV